MRIVSGGWDSHVDVSSGDGDEDEDEDEGLGEWLADRLVLKSR